MTSTLPNSVTGEEARTPSDEQSTTENDNKKIVENPDDTKRQEYTVEPL